MNQERIDYLLVGGGLASAKCEAALRQQGAVGRVAIVGAESYAPYNRPPLSKGLLLGYDQPERIFVFPSEFYEENEIELFEGAVASSLDLDNREVKLADGRSLEYKKLLIATGTTPRRLAVPGADLQNIFYLRNLDDSLAIADAMRPGSRAIIVGAGFIGMELAAAFAEKGVETTMLVRDSGLFTKLGSEELSRFFSDYYQQHGIQIIYEDEVKEFDGNDVLGTVVTQDGRELPADMAAVGIGVVANTDWLEGSGLEIDRGVVVDESLRASAPDVFAAGDIAVYYDPIFQKRRRVEHWDNAVKQGELAAANMLGESRSVDYVAYFYSDLFDLSWEWLGDNSGVDDTVVRLNNKGEPELVYYLKDGQLRAAFLLLQGPDERQWVERAIRSGVDLTADLGRLSDPTVSLKDILLEESL